MDTGSVGIGMVVTLFTVVQAVWYIGVLYLLFRIWQKVRHLPG